MEENLLCRPFTVLFNSSILESRLLSLARIRSNLFVTPSESLKAAITSSSSSEVFTSGDWILSPVSLQVTLFGNCCMYCGKIFALGLHIRMKTP